MGIEARGLLESPEPVPEVSPELKATADLIKRIRKLR
jgi:hypothetical protein